MLVSGKRTKYFLLRDRFFFFFLCTLFIYYALAEINLKTFFKYLFLFTYFFARYQVRSYSQLGLKLWL